MGEVKVLLTDVICYKNKQNFKRIPFTDRSNYSNMSVGAVQPLTLKKKTRQIKKSKGRCCSCHKAKNSEECLKCTHRYLRVVIERCNSNDLFVANKIPSEIDKDKLKSMVDAPNQKVNGMKELKINLTPISIEKFRNKTYPKINCSKANLGDDNTNINSQNTKDCLQYTGLHLLQNNEVINDSIDMSNNLDYHDVPSSETNINQNRLIKEYVCTNAFEHKTNNKNDKLASNTSISKRLRPCVKKDYLEISEFSEHEKSVPFDKEHKRIPVYKQIVIKELVAKKKDPYELDVSDFDERTVKKVKFRNPSEKFDKTMHEIIKKLEKKHHKQPRKKKILNASPKYEDKINSVLHRVMEKVNKKKVEDNFHKPLNPEKVQNKIAVAAHPDIQTQNRTDITSQNCNTNGKNTSSSVSNTCIPYEKTNENINCFNEVFINEENEYPRCSSSLSTASAIESVRGYSPSPYYTETETETNKYFDFDEDEQVLPQLNNNRIKIISDVTLNSSFHSKRNPIEQSRRVLQPYRSPWRLNAIRKSNYVVLYKDNALPCLKQDAVVDYNLAEKIEESFSKNKSCLQTSQKSHIQTSILDYVDSLQTCKSISDRENIIPNNNHPSLYDYEEFEVDQSKKRSDKNRTVLGVINANILNKEFFISTPVKENRNGAMPNLDISVIGKTTAFSTIHEPESFQNGTLVDNNEPCFGFNSSSSIGCDLNHCPSNEKPFRISMGAIKSYKKQNRNNENLVELLEHAEDLPSVLNNESSDQPNEEIRIFDDVEPEVLITADIVSIIYICFGS